MPSDRSGIDTNSGVSNFIKEHTKGAGLTLEKPKVPKIPKVKLKISPLD